MLPASPIRDFVVLCNPENRRVAFFQAALARFGFPRAEVVAYKDFLKGNADLRSVMTPGCVLRIESPGENFEVEKALLALGAHEQDGGTPVPRLSRKQADSLSFDKGRIHYLAQWFFGFRAAMVRVKSQLTDFGTAFVMNEPEAIITMFDKGACHAMLEAAGIPVPQALPPASSFGQILNGMAQRGWSRVFIKPVYGSSASGVIAFAQQGEKMVVYTSVEAVDSGGEVELYNSLRVRRYEKPEQIRVIIDTLCRERVHVERWVSKAGIEGASFDLRVVVSGGQATHAVVRMSPFPITNLHLGNRRGNITAVQERMGEDKWNDALRTCKRALGVLPNAHYAGIDLAVEAGFRNHSVLEMNAFGDLLPNVLTNGLDTYAAEIAGFCEPAQAIVA